MSLQQHIISNFNTLATTKLRRDSLLVLESGLKAINTESVVKNNCKLLKTKLSIKDKIFDLKNYDNVYIIGIGKAAFDAGKTLEKILGNKITDGILLDVKSGKLKKLKSIVGTHPFPSLTNMRATGEIIAFLKHLTSKDLVITIISGGGSALLCWPYELNCDQLTLIQKLLMKSGASIQEINTVRKHLSEIQGGQFARLAYPATVVGLIFSDVPGDDLGLVASGPTIMDMSTTNDARAIIERYNLLKACRLPHCDLQETPKDPIYFQKVTNFLLVNNVVALNAMAEKARQLGYATRVYSHVLSGEAREVGRALAGLVKRGEMLLAGGETTVTVRGSGVGGRNQELALGAFQCIKDDTLVLSCASDGVDNTPVAGAIADALSLEKTRKKHADFKKALLYNDSYPFFKSINGQIITGITGANVSDLMIAVRA